MQVFYVNVGGGEPTVRGDFFELVEHCVEPPRRGEVLDQRDPHRRRRGDAGSPRMDYVDVQVSIDGADAATNDAVRGAGSFDAARRAMDNLAGGGVRAVQDLGRRDPPERGPARRLRRAGRPLRRPAAADPPAPVGPGADVWDELHPTDEPERDALRLAARARRRCSPGDSFFHLSGARRAAATASTSAGRDGSSA